MEKSHTASRTTQHLLVLYKTVAAQRILLFHSPKDASLFHYIGHWVDYTHIASCREGHWLNCQYASLDVNHLCHHSGAPHPALTLPLPNSFSDLSCPCLGCPLFSAPELPLMLQKGLHSLTVAEQ